MIEDCDHWQPIEHDTRKQTMVEFQTGLGRVFSGDTFEFVQQEYAEFESKYGMLDTWATELKDGMYEMHFGYDKCKDQQTADAAAAEKKRLLQLNDQR